MTKVSTLIGDFAAPQGDMGREVSWEAAAEVAAIMRGILNQDLDEEDIARSVYDFNSYLNLRQQEELVAAWELLNAGERATWKRFVNYDQWLFEEKLRARD